MDKVPCVVIGAGAVGLSIAKALSEVGIAALVLEKHGHFGEENSSRNSEVVHAGIYYEPTALKTKLCVEGRHLLGNYMKSRAIPHENCGKLVIATNKNDEGALKKLYEKGLANGVSDLRLISKQEAEEMEPNMTCTHAIWSPSTSIFDTHNLMLSYVTDIENSDSNIIYNCEVESVDPFTSTSTSSSTEFKVNTTQGTIACQYLINASGLHAQHTANKMTTFPKQFIPTPYFAKGNYYKLSGYSVKNRPFNRLIYPLPSQGGLGIHVTLDLNGGIRFGPDIEWIKNPATIHTEGVDPYAFDSTVPPYTDFKVNETLAKSFAEDVSQYFPTITESQLVPDYAGIRPTLFGPCTMLAPHNQPDFCIQDSTTHGVRGLVNLYGVESPGMTASLAIGNYVRDIILKEK